MCIGPEAQLFIDKTKLKNVSSFKYLGSYVTNDCSMTEELTARIQATSCAFGRLRHRVFDSHDLTYLTKVKEYNLCPMHLLMYGSETWPLNYQQVRQLRTVKMGPLHQQRRSSRKSMCGRYRNIISKKSTTLARPCVQNGR